jgi:membrane fusion protein (multidrug efflux system)
MTPDTDAATARRPSLAKRMIVMLIIVGVTFGAIFGFQIFKGIMIKKAMAAFGAPPQTVSTIKAGIQEWQPRLEAVGSLRAVNGADLGIEVAGVVDGIYFNSGEDVPQGALLLRLRLDEAPARLQSLQASAKLAGITYQRDLKQFQAHAVSQQTVDSDKWTLENYNAQVAQQQALLNEKFLRAPFAGRLGVRQVDLGQYLSPGTSIVTLQQLDPIYLDFFLPQQTLHQIKVGQPVMGRVDTYPGQQFAGEISAINSKVDLTTRNVQIRGTFKNPDHKLVPGMYGTVEIDVGERQNYITLPQTAITFSSYGDTVYVVEDKGKAPDGRPQLVAHQSFVTTGATRGDQIAVLTGIKQGETVVTAGQIKLHNGSPVIVNNTVQPGNDPNPKPVDE